MNEAIKKGFGFGVTSGIITTLGLMVGLFSSTNSKLVILGGIITIAIADACSDALGIHLSEEISKKKNSLVWQSTFSTLFFKFIFSAIFILPLLIFKIKLAVIIAVIFGLIILGIFSYYIAKQNKAKPYKVVLEHISIAIFVIILTYFVGKLVNYIL